MGAPRDSSMSGLLVAALTILLAAKVQADAPVEVMLVLVFTLPQAIMYFTVLLAFACPSETGLYLGRASTARFFTAVSITCCVMAGWFRMQLPPAELAMIADHVKGAPRLVPFVQIVLLPCTGAFYHMVTEPLTVWGSTASRAAFSVALPTAFMGTLWARTGDEYFLHRFAACWLAIIAGFCAMSFAVRYRRGNGSPRQDQPDLALQVAKTRTRDITFCVPTCANLFGHDFGRFESTARGGARVFSRGILFFVAVRLFGALVVPLDELSQLVKIRSRIAHHEAAFCLHLGVALELLPLSFKERHTTIVLLLALMNLTPFVVLHRVPEASSDPNLLACNGSLVAIGSSLVQLTKAAVQVGQALPKGAGHTLDRHAPRAHVSWARLLPVLGGPILAVGYLVTARTQRLTEEAVNGVSPFRVGTLSVMVGVSPFCATIAVVIACAYLTWSGARGTAARVFSGGMVIVCALRLLAVWTLPLAELSRLVSLTASFKPARTLVAVQAFLTGVMLEGLPVPPAQRHLTIVLVVAVGGLAAGAVFHRLHPWDGDAPMSLLLAFTLWVCIGAGVVQLARAVRSALAAGAVPTAGAGVVAGAEDNTHLDPPHAKTPLLLRVEEPTAAPPAGMSIRGWVMTRRPTTGTGTCKPPVEISGAPPSSPFLPPPSCCSSLPPSAPQTPSLQPAMQAGRPPPCPFRWLCPTLL